jgi:hypothetical protein
VAVIDRVSETVVVTLAPVFADGFENKYTTGWSSTVQ